MFDGEKGVDLDQLGRSLAFWIASEQEAHEHFWLAQKEREECKTQWQEAARRAQMLFDLVALFGGKAPNLSHEVTTRWFQAIHRD